MSDPIAQARQARELMKQRKLDESVLINLICLLFAITLFIVQPITLAIFETITTIKFNFDITT
jgi:YbbR domain-containing protein